MLVLKGKYKVTKILRRIGLSALKGIKEGDTFEIHFTVNGTGGNSPKVDIFINGNYTGTTFARNINEVLNIGKKVWNRDILDYEHEGAYLEFEEVTNA